MDSITLSVRVRLAREEAFALLDELANHVVDWSFDGPVAGVGGSAGRGAGGPSQQWLDADVIESVPPRQDGRQDRWRERAPHDGGVQRRGLPGDMRFQLEHQVILDQGSWR